MSGEVKRSQDREPSRARGTPSILRASAHFAIAVAIMTLGCGHLLPSQKMNAVGFDVALAEVAKTALDARSKGVPLGDEVEVEFAVKTSYSGKAGGRSGDQVGRLQNSLPRDCATAATARRAGSSATRFGRRSISTMAKGVCPCFSTYSAGECRAVASDRASCSDCDGGGCALDRHGARESRGRRLLGARRTSRAGVLLCAVGR